MSLSQKQQGFAQMVALLIQKAKSLGYEVTLGEAYRPPEVHRYMHRTAVGFPIPCIPRNLPLI